MRQLTPTLAWKKGPLRYSRDLRRCRWTPATRVQPSSKLPIQLIKTKNHKVLLKRSEICLCVILTNSFLGSININTISEWFLKNSFSFSFIKSIQIDKNKTHTFSAALLLGKKIFLHRREVLIHLFVYVPEEQMRVQYL